MKKQLDRILGGTEEKRRGASGRRGSAGLWGGLKVEIREVDRKDHHFWAMRGPFGPDDRLQETGEFPAIDPV